MTEQMIREVPVQEITLEEVFRAEGADYSKRSPRPGMVDLHNMILQEATGLVRPLAIWGEFAVSGIGEHELLLEGGLKLTSSLLTKVAGTAEKLVLFAMTIGSTIDKTISDYNQAGQLLEGFALDATATTHLAKSATFILAEIQNKYKETGMSITFPLGPGHSYWSGLEDIRTIINNLAAEQIGISLTDSNLMVPRKSIALVMGVGRNLPDFKGKNHCDFCSLQKTCNNNKFGQRCGDQHLGDLTNP